MKGDTFPKWFTETDRIYELCQLVPDDGEHYYVLSGPDIDQQIYPMAKCLACNGYDALEVVSRGHTYRIRIEEVK